MTSMKTATQQFRLAYGRDTATLVRQLTSFSKMDIHAELNDESLSIADQQVKLANNEKSLNDNKHKLFKTVSLINACVDQRREQLELLQAQPGTKVAAEEEMKDLAEKILSIEQPLSDTTKAIAQLHARQMEAGRLLQGIGGVSVIDPSTAPPDFDAYISGEGSKGDGGKSTATNKPDTQDDFSTTGWGDSDVLGSGTTPSFATDTPHTQTPHDSHNPTHIPSQQQSAQQQQTNFPFQHQQPASQPPSFGLGRGSGVPPLPFQHQGSVHHVIPPRTAVPFAPTQGQQSDPTALAYAPSQSQQYQQMVALATHSPSAQNQLAIVPSHSTLAFKDLYSQQLQDNQVLQQQLAYMQQQMQQMQQQQLNQTAPGTRPYGNPFAPTTAQQATGASNIPPYNPGAGSQAQSVGQLGISQFTSSHTRMPNQYPHNMANPQQPQMAPAAPQLSAQRVPWTAPPPNMTQQSFPPSTPLITPNAAASALPPPPPHMMALMGAPNTQSTNPDVYNRMPRLKKTEPERFDGNPLHFHSWYETFYELVGKHPDEIIPIVEKMQWLKRSVKPDTPAAQIVQRVLLANGGYQSAIEALYNKYSNPTLLQVTLQGQLQDLKPAGMFTKSLRSTYDTLRTILSQMQQTGVCLDAANGLPIISLITQKFPREFYRQVDEVLDINEHWTMDNLLRRINTLIEKRERAEIMMGPDRHDNERGNKGHGAQQHPKQPMASTTNMFQSSQNARQPNRRPDTRGNQQQQRFPAPNRRNEANNRNRDKPREPKRPCLFCGEGHWDADCVKFPDAFSRRRQLFQDQRCLLCSSKEHIKPSCKSPPRSCRHCQEKGSHLESCCPKQFPTKARNPGHSTEAPRAATSFKKPQPGRQGERPTHTTVAGMLNTSRPHQRELDPREIAYWGDTLNLNVVSTEDEMPALTVRVLVLSHNPKSSGYDMPQAVLDSGSQRSFITDKEAAKLQLPILRSETLAVHRLNHDVTFIESNRVQLSIATVDTWVDCTCDEERPSAHPCLCTDEIIEVNHDSGPILVEANTVSEITPGVYYDSLFSDVDTEYLQQSDPEYRHMFADNYTQKPFYHCPQILFGANIMWHFIGESKKRELPSGRLLVPTKFGLGVTGCANQNTRTPDMCQWSITSATQSYLTDSHQMVVEPETRSRLETMLDTESFYSLEHIGISAIEDNQTTDLQSRTIFDETITFTDRYSVCLPRRNQDFLNLPDNKGVAMAQMKSQLVKMKQNDSIRQKANAIIEEQMKLGIVEIAPEVADGPEYYLPWHLVFTPSKITTKVRLVFNGSSKTPKTANSLNDVLLRGDVNLPNVAIALINAMLVRILISSDIQKAFLQIGINVQDRDLLRFFWEIAGVIVILRLTRVPFGIICSPWLLQAVIEHHLKIQPEGSYTKIHNLINDFYVDNWFRGVTNTAAGIEYYLESTKMMKEAKMVLLQWATNDSGLRQYLQENFPDDCADVVTSILGYSWNTESDMLQFRGPSAESMAFTGPLTKRKLFKVVASIFDLIGFMCPLTLPFKLLVQDTWTEDSKPGWNDPLSEYFVESYNAFLPDVMAIDNICLPRCTLTGPTISECELHIFADASVQAYAVASYLVSSPNGKFEGEAHSRLLMAKQRLSPTKTHKEQELTIPRLELTALWMAFRQALFLITNKLTTEAPIKRIVWYSDSQAVLHWIRGHSFPGVYVRNRVHHIIGVAEKLNVEYDMALKYVPTALNPADLATRPNTVTPEQLSDPDCLWFIGPEFIINKQLIPRPTEDFTWNIPKNSPEMLSSAKPPKDIGTFSLATVLKAPATPLLPLSGIRPWTFQQGTTAYALRFIAMKYVPFNHCMPDSIFKFLTPAELQALTAPGPLTMEHRRLANMYWFAQCQREMMGEIIHALQTEEKPTNPAIIRQMGLFLDDHGLIRVRHRLSNATGLSESARFPVLLPGNHLLTTKLIDYCHQKLGHGGLQTTLAMVRSMIWIPKGRQVVKKVISKCVACKKRHGGPFRMPEFPDLPKVRVNSATAFSQVGIDHLGPLYYKSDGKTEKAWVLLITCLVTRAVHLEVVTSMSAQACVNSLKRFIARRGTPRFIISDNSTTFLTTKEFFTSFPMTEPDASKDLTSYLADHSITWHNIVARAPFQGGVWERIVALVKLAMVNILGRRKLHCLDDLTTHILQTEAIVNSRPITYVYSDVGSPVILTPNDLIGGSRTTGLKPWAFDIDEYEDPTFNPAQTREAVRIAQLYKENEKRLAAAWIVWQDEVLPDIRNKKIGRHPQGRVVSDEVPTKGHCVLIKDDQLKRGQYLAGVITELDTSSDGSVRSAHVKLPSGNILRRSVGHLYPFELLPENPVLPSALDRLLSDKWKRGATARSQALKDLGIATDAPQTENESEDPQLEDPQTDDQQTDDPQTEVLQTDQQTPTPAPRRSRRLAGKVPVITLLALFFFFGLPGCHAAPNMELPSTDFLTMIERIMIAVMVTGYGMCYCSSTPTDTPNMEDYDNEATQEPKGTSTSVSTTPIVRTYIFKPLPFGLINTPSLYEQWTQFLRYRVKLPRIPRLTVGPTERTQYLVWKLWAIPNTRKIVLRPSGRINLTYTEIPQMEADIDSSNPSVVITYRHPCNPYELSEVIDSDVSIAQPGNSTESYLPWSIVCTPAKPTTKVRIVYDGRYIRLQNIHNHPSPPVTNRPRTLSPATIMALIVLCILFGCTPCSAIDKHNDDNTTEQQRMATLLSLMAFCIGMTIQRLRQMRLIGINNPAPLADSPLSTPCSLNSCNGPSTPRYTPLPDDESMGLGRSASSLTIIISDDEESEQDRADSSLTNIIIHDTDVLATLAPISPSEDLSDSSTPCLDENKHNPDCQFANEGFLTVQVCVDNTHDTTKVSFYQARLDKRNPESYVSEAFASRQHDITTRSGGRVEFTIRPGRFRTLHKFPFVMPKGTLPISAMVVRTTEQRLTQFDLLSLDDRAAMKNLQDDYAALLADRYAEFIHHVDPDIVIGSDYLDRIVDRDCANYLLPSGKYLLSTIFGYVLSPGYYLPPCAIGKTPFLHPSHTAFTRLHVLMDDILDRNPPKRQLRPQSPAPLDSQPLALMWHHKWHEEHETDPSPVPPVPKRLKNCTPITPLLTIIGLISLFPVCAADGPKGFLSDTSPYILSVLGSYVMGFCAIVVGILLSRERQKQPPDPEPQPTQAISQRTMESESGNDSGTSTNIGSDSDSESSVSTTTAPSSPDSERTDSPRSRIPLCRHAPGKLRRAPRMADLRNFALITLIAIGPGLHTSNACEKTIPRNGELLEQYVELLYVEECMNEGRVVWRVRANDLHCSATVKCGHKHVAPDASCLSKCTRCPAWATDCTWPWGGSVRMQKYQTQILNGMKPNEICSTTPHLNHPLCSTNVTVKSFTQIFVKDETKHLVEHFKIRISDHREDEFFCVSNSTHGTMAIPERASGSDIFCRSHPCDFSASTYCFQRKSRRAYIVDDYGEEVPILAWGLVKVKFYGYKQGTNEQCDDCEVSCSEGKVYISGTPDDTDLLEVIMQTTVSHAAVMRYEDPPSHKEVKIPLPLALYNTTVKVESWKLGHRTHLLEIQCPAASICQLIGCRFCMEYIKNPQCYGIGIYILFLSVLAIVTLGLVILFQKVTGRRMPHLLAPLTDRLVQLRGMQLLGRTSEDTDTGRESLEGPDPMLATYHRSVEGDHEHVSVYIPTVEPIRRRPNYMDSPTPSPAISLVALSIIMSASLIAVTQGCRLATTLTASSHQCIVDKKSIQRCTMNEVTRLTTGTYDTCLVINDANGKPTGRITVTIGHVRSKCEKATLYFTRSFATKVESVKRCATAGSCTGNTCELLTHDTIIPELSSQANNGLGSSQCVESCGCISCGCFFCSSGCLFYREFVTPTTPTIYEVFRCPSFHHEVRVTVKLQTEDDLRTETVSLSPSSESPMFGGMVKLALISFSEPDRPLMATPFVTDRTRTAMTESAPAGVPEIGIVGQLQCPTREAASNETLRKCFTSTGACDCVPRQNSVGCTCSDVSIEERFSPRNVLPIHTRTQLWTPDPDYGVIIDEVEDTLVELQLSLKGLTLSTVSRIDKCTITILSLYGCYGCSTGASIHMACKSKYDTIAKVECPHNQFAIPCSPTSQQTIAQATFSQSVVQEQCTATCGSTNNITTFPLHGTLSYLPPELVANRRDLGGTPLKHFQIVGLIGIP